MRGVSGRSTDKFCLGVAGQRLSTEGRNTVRPVQRAFLSPGSADLIPRKYTSIPLIHTYLCCSQSTAAL